MLAHRHISTTTLNDSSSFDKSHLEEGIIIDLPNKIAICSPNTCSCPSAPTKDSSLSGKTTRGCSPKTEEKRTKLNSKSPYFAQIEGNIIEDCHTHNMTAPWLQTPIYALENTIINSKYKTSSSDCMEVPVGLETFSEEENNDFEVKYKTEICRNYQLTGQCRFGSKCSFAHGEVELRNKKHINLHYKSKVCNQFFELGYCPYGNRCQYLHIADSFSHTLSAYTEKILVWMERNPTMEMAQIISKTHPFVKRLSIFEKLESSGTTKVPRSVFPHC